MSPPMGSRLSVRRAWLLVCAALLAIILIPFYFWGGSIDAWIVAFLGDPLGDVVAGAGIVLFLATDVVLPVPSSFVSTAAGIRFGFLGGMLLSWLGMTLGGWIAYELGRRFGRTTANALAGERAMRDVAATAERYGTWSVVVFRAVPVLAEASVLLAGVAGVRLPRFLATSSLANLGVSAAYAAVGSWSLSTRSFLLAFAGSILIPAVLLLLVRTRPLARRSWISVE